MRLQIMGRIDADQIYRYTDVAQNIMFSFWKQFQDTRFIHIQPTRGLPSATTVKDYCYLSITARLKNYTKSSHISRDL